MRGRGDDTNNNIIYRQEGHKNGLNISKMSFLLHGQPVITIFKETGRNATKAVGNWSYNSTKPLVCHHKVLGLDSNI